MANHQHIDFQHGYHEQRQFSLSLKHNQRLEMYVSQSIEVGSILGGRYQVTEFVMTTAEGDLVLEGIDQVLNRSVSILVASTDNSSQLASSAREIAMEERMANVQVLDLGVTDSNQSYLVTNTANSADLLDLVIENDAPYVEPFYTDTLGTEIFGESRQAVPQTYEDDVEYYEHLGDEEQGQPQGRIGNALSSGLNSLSGLKNRFGRKNVAESDDESSEHFSNEEAHPTTAPTATASDAPATTESAVAKPANQPDSDPETAPTSTASEHTTPLAATQPASSKPQNDQTAAAQKPKVTRLPDEEPNVTATAALSSAELSKGNNASPKDADTSSDQGSAKPAAAAAGGAVAGAAAAAGGAVAGAAAGAAAKQPKAAEKDKAAIAGGTAAATGNGSKAKTFPAAAKNIPVPVPKTQTPAEEGTSSKTTRVLVGAVLIAVLVIGVVFAFNFLGGGQDEPVAQSPSSPAENSQSAEPTQEPSGTPSELPAPSVVEVSRLVPGNQSLNAEYDANLPRMIDGNPANAYNTYSYTTPNFGGFASNMVFILELEEPSKISEVTLDGLNASGGTYQILIGDTDDLGEANAVANGSFTGPSLSVPVSEEQSAGQYVFLNVTELPRRASGANASRPYGLQIGEFSVK